MKNDNVKLAENIIKGMAAGGVSPTELLIGLHNTMAFGKLWIVETDGTIGDYDAIGDYDLQEIMEKMNQLIDVSKRIDKN